MNKLDLKILGVKFYQGVKLAGEVHSYIQPNTKTNTPNYEAAIGYELAEVENGILIRKGNKATLTSWNNVQYIEYDILKEASTAPTEIKQKK